MEDKQTFLCGLERDHWRECRNLDARSTSVEAFKHVDLFALRLEPTIVPMIIPGQMRHASGRPLGLFTTWKELF
jgi:hypothetical protein